MGIICTEDYLNAYNYCTKQNMSCVGDINFISKLNATIYKDNIMRDSGHSAERSRRCNRSPNSDNIRSKQQSWSKVFRSPKLVPKLDRHSVGKTEMKKLLLDANEVESTIANNLENIEPHIKESVMFNTVHISPISRVVVNGKSPTAETIGKKKYLISFPRFVCPCCCPGDAVDADLGPYSKQDSFDTVDLNPDRFIPLTSQASITSLLDLYDKMRNEKPPNLILKFCRRFYTSSA